MTTSEPLPDPKIWIAWWRYGSYGNFNVHRKTNTSSITLFIPPQRSEDYSEQFCIRILMHELEHHAQYLYLNPEEMTICSKDRTRHNRQLLERLAYERSGVR